MVGQWTSQVRKMVGMQISSRQAAFMRVMLCLALFMLIGGTASIDAARHEDESAPSQWVYVRLADGIQVSDDAGVSWTHAARAVEPTADDGGCRANEFAGDARFGVRRH